MAENKDSRNEVHVTKKVASMNESMEYGVSLVSPTDSMDQLTEKAKMFISELSKK